MGLRWIVGFDHYSRADRALMIGGRVDVPAVRSASAGLQDCRNGRRTMEGTERNVGQHSMGAVIDRCSSAKRRFSRPSHPSSVLLEACGDTSPKNGSLDLDSRFKSSFLPGLRLKVGYARWG